MPCRAVRWFLFFLLLIPLAPAVASEPPQVVVSIRPIHSLVAGLMSGVGVPELLVRDGSPLDFRPDAAQRARLQAADLVLWVGPELESGLAEALPGLEPRGQVRALLDNSHLKILPAGADGHDPFFWLDARNAQILIDELLPLLTALDPDRERLYRENHARMKGELSRLDWELEVNYRALKSGRIYLYDPTQNYFAQAYAMRTAGSVNARAGGPTAATDLLKAHTRLAAGEAGCLLYEEALPHPELDLLRTAGVEDVAIDSFGTRFTPGPELYAQLLRAHFRAIAGCFGEVPAAVQESRPAEEGGAVPEGAVGGRYMLLNQDGGLVTEETYLGHYQLIYFGYTFCPDICPTALGTMSAALRLLGKAGDRIQSLFVSVDPERDTVAVLHEYVGYFHPRLVGLTGRPEMIAKLAEGYRVRYQKYLPEGAPPERYSMDHTASVYLLGPHGHFITKFAHGISPAQMAAELKRIMD